MLRRHLAVSRRQLRSPVALAAEAPGASGPGKVAAPWPTGAQDFPDTAPATPNSPSSGLQKAGDPWVPHKQHELAISRNELVFCINLFPSVPVTVNGPIIHLVAQIGYPGGLWIPPHSQSPGPDN